MHLKGVLSKLVFLRVQITYFSMERIKNRYSIHLSPFSNLSKAPLLPPALHSYSLTHFPAFTHPSDKSGGARKRSYHFPESSGVKTGAPDVIEGEWRPIEIDMMRLCSHRFTTLLSKQRAHQSKYGAPPGKQDDDITPLSDEWIPNDHRFFAVVLLEKFTTLRDLARIEDWGPDLRFLRLYLDHTFRRVSELSKSQRTLMGFFPLGSTEATHACFNTGLLTRNIEKLYACFHLNSRSNETPMAAGPPGSSQHQIPRWFLYGFQTESQLISPAKMKVYHGTCEFNSAMLPQRGPFTLQSSVVSCICPSYSLFSI
jgi:hypothetical protein